MEGKNVSCQDTGQIDSERDVTLAHAAAVTRLTRFALYASIGIGVGAIIAACLGALVLGGQLAAAVGLVAYHGIAVVYAGYRCVHASWEPLE